MKSLKFFLVAFGVGFFSNLKASRECNLRVKSGEVGVLRVPLGAASTVETTREFQFAVVGNQADFKVTAVKDDAKLFVIQATNSAARKTSLTIGMRNSRPLSLWVIPTNMDSGCVYTKISRGF